MIFYVRCGCRSSDKLAIQKLKQLGHEVREVKFSPEWRTESRQYNLKLPFKVINEQERLGEEVSLSNYL